jgi:hypothetical protein
MSKLNYLPHWSLIKRAWAAAWRHKSAWVFGLVAFTVDFGGAFESIFKALPTGGAGGLAGGAWVGLLMPVSLVWSSLVGLAYAQTATAVILALVGVVVAALIFAAAAAMVGLGVGALVWMAERIAQGKPANWRQGLKVAGRSLWPLTLVIVIMKLGTILTLSLAALVLRWLVIEPSVVSLVAFLLAFALFSAVSVIAAISSVFTVHELVVSKRPLAEAIKMALTGFRRHWIAALEAAAMILAATMVAVGAGMAVFLVLAVPILFGVALFAYLKLAFLVKLLYALTWFVAGAIIILTAAVAGTVQVFAWNAFWQKISHRTFVHHFFGWLSKLFRR